MTLKQRSNHTKVSTPWQTGKPAQAGIYIIFDGHWQRRVRFEPGRRYNDELQEWCSLRGYPVVYPKPLKFREDDESWGK